MAEPQPAARSVIETDTFCEACGFNLMTQPVWRDERLDILICRCPECGRHHPAQNKATIGTAWLHRLGTLGLILWVGLILLVVTAMYFGMIGQLAAGEELLTYRRDETVDGRPVNQTWDPKTGMMIYVLQNEAAPTTAPTTMPTVQVRQRRYRVSWLGGPQVPPGNRYGGNADPVQAGFVMSLFVVGILVTSSFLASVSWFWRRGRKWAWIALPPLSFVTMLVLSQEGTRSTIYGQAQAEEGALRSVDAGVLVLQLIVMATGIALGRAFARVALLMFVPPRARQVFAFLWLCDGKTPPAAKGSTTPP